MRHAVFLAAAFVILTAAVGTGLSRPVDRFAIGHLQPLSDTSVASTVAPSEPPRALGPVLHGDRSLLISVGAIVFAPADSLPALAIVAVAALVLYRRGRSRAAAAWVVAFIAGLAIEGGGKLLIDQIQYSPSSTIAGVTLRGSYPSGHTIRSVIVAALVVTMWPRGRLLAIAWVLYVTCLLEIGGLHVPTDIAGGFLAAGALVCAAISYGRPPIRAATEPGTVQSGRHGPAQASRPAHVPSPPGAADGGGG
jgi:membrane-associated phospholipid phosphatase